MAKEIKSNILVYAKGLLSSRALGLIRDLAIGITLGVGFKSDILLIALTLPDFLANIYFGSGAQLALLPFFQKFSKEAALYKLKKILLAFVLLSFPLLTLLVLFKTQILHFFIPAYTSNEIYHFLSSDALTTLFVISSLMLLAVPLRSYLQANKDFKSLGMENVLFNISALVGVGVYHLTSQESLLFLLLSMSFLVRLAWLAARVHTFTKRHNILASKPKSDETYLFPIKQIFNSSLFSVILIAIPVIIRSYSTYLGAGWATKFVFANRLVDAALLVFTTIIGSVVFSELPLMLAKSKEKLMENFALIVMFALPFLGLLGFWGTYLTLNQLDPTSEIYSYLYILLALSIFIPARLFIHYYNLILIADEQSQISGLSALLSAGFSFLAFKLFPLPLSNPNLLIFAQAFLIYPICLTLLGHLVFSKHIRLHFAAFFCCIYTYFQVCYWYPKLQAETLTIGFIILSGSAYYLWKNKKRFFAF